MALNLKRANSNTGKSTHSQASALQADYSQARDPQVPPTARIKEGNSPSLIAKMSLQCRYFCATITARNGISSVPALLDEESQIPVRK
jgi:hypothetical protein